MVTYRIITAEAKAQTVSLVRIERICIQDSYIHLPFLEVIGGYKVNARRKGLLYLQHGIRASRSVSPSQSNVYLSKLLKCQSVSKSLPRLCLIQKLVLMAYLSQALCCKHSDSESAIGEPTNK